MNKHILVSLILLSLLPFYYTHDYCRILALSGGGAHGSFEAGVIDRLNKMNYNWDVITGVSVGSINTGMLAMYTQYQQSTAIDKLKALWLNLTSNNVYKVNYDPIYDQSLYDNTPLYNTINNTLKQYNGILKRKIYISATEVNSGDYVIFTNHNMPTLQSVVDTIISSSSIPLYFPPKLMNGKYYMDGGLYSNELIDSAVYHCQSLNKTNITIDVILASDPLTNITTNDIKKYTIFGIMYRAYELMTNSLFNHELYKHCSKGYPSVYI